jgi:peroxiredoxin
MAALEQGAKAPVINLPLVNGEQFSLEAARKKGLVVVVFFKISCPVCQFALPYFERLFQAVKGKQVTVLGVSQNTAKDTQFFMKQYGITFPVALDDPTGYPVSNAYGITNVPTIFYITEDGKIDISAVGWSRKDVEEIARRVSEEEKVPPIAVIRPGEEVPAFRAG